MQMDVLDTNNKNTPSKSIDFRTGTQHAIGSKSQYENKNEHRPTECANNNNSKGNKGRGRSNQAIERLIRRSSQQQQTTNGQCMTSRTILQQQQAILIC